jgi:hypothetical protein
MLDKEMREKLNGNSRMVSVHRSKSCENSPLTKNATQHTRESNFKKEVNRYLTGYSGSEIESCFQTSSLQDVSEQFEVIEKIGGANRKSHRYAPIENVYFDNEFSNGLLVDGDE